MIFIYRSEFYYIRSGRGGCQGGQSCSGSTYQRPTPYLLREVGEELGLARVLGVAGLEPPADDHFAATPLDPARRDPALADGGRTLAGRQKGHPLTRGPLGGSLPPELALDQESAQNSTPAPSLLCLASLSYCSC